MSELPLPRWAPLISLELIFIGWSIILRMTAADRAREVCGAMRLGVKSSLGPDIERDPEPSAERVLIAREELRQVQGALDKLPTLTKEIFVNYRIEGVPQKTIAEMLGVSLSSVEKHLQRAYQTVLAIREQQHEPGAVMTPEGAVHVRRS